MALLPDLPWRLLEDRSYDVLESDPLSGFYDRRRVNDALQREFTIEWTLLYASQLTELETAFDNAAGMTGTATFTHPIAGVLTVRFLEDRLSVRRSNDVKATASVRVAIELAGVKS